MAYINVFDTVNGDGCGAGGDGYGYRQPAWVFPHKLGNSREEHRRGGHPRGRATTSACDHDGNADAGLRPRPRRRGRRSWASATTTRSASGARATTPAPPTSRTTSRSSAASPARAPTRRRRASSLAAPGSPPGRRTSTSRTDVDTYLLGTCTGTVSVDREPAAVAGQPRPPAARSSTLSGRSSRRTIPPSAQTTEQHRLRDGCVVDPDPRVRHLLRVGGRRRQRSPGPPATTTTAPSGRTRLAATGCDGIPADADDDLAGRHRRRAGPSPSPRRRRPSSGSSPARWCSARAPPSWARRCSASARPSWSSPPSPRARTPTRRPSSRSAPRTSARPRRPPSVTVRTTSTTALTTSVTGRDVGARRPGHHRRRCARGHGRGPRRRQPRRHRDPRRRDRDAHAPVRGAGRPLLPSHVRAQRHGGVRRLDLGGAARHRRAGRDVDRPRRPRPPAATVTLAAAVTSGPRAFPTGVVELREGTTLLGTVPLSAGAASLALADVALGDHTYTATYVPTGTFHLGSASPARSQTVVDASRRATRHPDAGPTADAHSPRRCRPRTRSRLRRRRSPSAAAPRP